LAAPRALEKRVLARPRQSAAKGAATLTGHRMRNLAVTGLLRP